MDDDGNLKSILDRIAQGNQTEADLEYLRSYLSNSSGDLQDVVQIGKYIISIGQGQDIRIGDQYYQGLSAEAIRSAIQDVLSASVSQVPPPPPPATPPVVAEFIGRETELAYFAEKFKTTHLAVIAGLAGVGKTTLAAVLARQVSPPEKIFWHSFRADEGVEAVIWELAGFLAWHGRDNLWQMLSRARQSGGQSAPPEMLFNYLVQELRSHGYVLCFDDLHLVDGDPLLAKLLDRLRDVMLAGELSFIIISRRMPGFVRAVEIEELRGLTREATRELISKRGVSLPEDLISDLYQVTEGNAQILTLAVEALRRAKDAKRIIAHLTSTDAVENYLMNQIDRGLTPMERLVMSGIAVLMGFPGTSDMVEAILQTSNIRRTLYNLQNRFLLTAQRSQAGLEYSQHPSIQAFYYNLLTIRECQVMHRRTGEYYERKTRQALLAARQFQLAGEPKLAANLLIPNYRSLLTSGQASLLAKTLEQFNVAELDLPLWIQTRIVLSKVYAYFGDVGLAYKNYQEADSELLELPVSPEVILLRKQVLRDLIRFARLQEDYEKAQNYFERSLQIAHEEQDTIQEVDILIELVGLLREKNDFEGAFLICQDSLQLAASIHYQSAMAHGRMEQAVIRSAQRRYADALDLFKAALEDALKTGDQILVRNIRKELASLEDLLARKVRKVFISYSSSDRTFAERLAKDLRAAGLGVWWDQWEIKVGDSIIQKISEGIRESAYLICILSPVSTQSSWVQRELGSALMIQLSRERKITVLPVKIADCDVPVLLREIKWADFIKGYELGLEELLDALAAEQTDPVY